MAVSMARGQSDSLQLYMMVWLSSGFIVRKFPEISFGYNFLIDFLIVKKFCKERDSVTIGQLKRMFWTNEISRELNLPVVIIDTC